MTPERTKKLFKDFPTLYAGHKESLQHNLMPFGFECQDGWEKIIRRLSEKLEPMGVKAMQVKEKFGGLRFYLDGGAPEEAHKLIQKAQEESYETCEECGKPGALRGGSWIQTLCDDHSEGRQKISFNPDGGSVGPSPAKTEEVRKV